MCLYEKHGNRKKKFFISMKKDQNFPFFVKRGRTRLESWNDDRPVKRTFK